MEPPPRECVRNAEKTDGPNRLLPSQNWPGPVIRSNSFPVEAESENRHPAHLTGAHQVCGLKLNFHLPARHYSHKSQLSDTNRRLVI